MSPTPENLVASGLDRHELDRLQRPGREQHLLLPGPRHGPFDRQHRLQRRGRLVHADRAGHRHLRLLLARTSRTPATWADWTVTEGPGPHTCGEFVAQHVRPASGPPAAAATMPSPFPSPARRLLPLTSTILDSPLIDLSITGIASVTLEYDIYYNHSGGDDATVEVWNGSSWVVLWADSNVDSTVTSLRRHRLRGGERRLPGPLQLPECQQQHVVLGGQRRGDRRHLQPVRHRPSARCRRPTGPAGDHPAARRPHDCVRRHAST